MAVQFEGDTKISDEPAIDVAKISVLIGNEGRFECRLGFRIVLKGGWAGHFFCGIGSGCFRFAEKVAHVR